jgi:hypothetical protein
VLTRVHHWSLSCVRCSQITRSHPISPTSSLVLSSHPRLGFPRCLFITKISYKCLISPMCVTCSTYPILLGLITLIIFVELCELRNYLFWDFNKKKSWQILVVFFRVMTPYSHVVEWNRIRVPPKRLVSYHITIWHYNTKDHDLNLHGRESLKAVILWEHQKYIRFPQALGVCVCGKGLLSSNVLNYHKHTFASPTSCIILIPHLD